MFSSCKMAYNLFALNTCNFLLCLTLIAERNDTSKMQPEVTAAVMHLKTMWWPRKSECEAEKEAASTVCSQSRTDSPPDQTSYTPLPYQINS